MRRNRVILLLLMIATVVLACVRGGTISYTLFYLTWLTPIISGCYLFYVYKSLRIHQSIEKNLLTKGEKVKYDFHLKNRSIVTCTGVKVVFFERLSEFKENMSKESFCLVPGQPFEKEMTLKVNYRGEYHIGIDKVEITDFFKLFKMTYVCPEPITVQVLPVVLHFENLVLDVEEYYDNVPIINLGQEALYPDVELRKYVSGDSARVINWKASAKSGELFSRKYVDETNAEVLLLADFSPTGLSGADKIIIEDKIVEASLGISDYLYRKNIKVNVLFFDRIAQILQVRSREELESFYVTCSKVIFDATCGCAELLLQSMLRGYTQIIIVTHELSSKNIAVAGELAAKGSRVEIVYVGDEDPKNIAGEATESIKITRISSEQEVEDVLERKI